MDYSLLLKEFTSHFSNVLTNHTNGDATIFGNQLKYNDIHELREIGDQLPDVETHDAFGYNDDADQWQEAPYKQSVWAEDPDTSEHVLVGITSANDDYWQPHQYGDIVELTADAVEHFQTDDDYEDFDVEGFIETTDTYHRFLNDMNFDGVEINPGDSDDPIVLGLREKSGNSGLHSTQYELGAERLICQNGMTRFVADVQYDQTHQEELDPTLPQIAVQSVLEGTDEVESKLEEAQQQHFRNKEEALALLYDLGIPQSLSLDYADTVLTFEDEVEERNNASQYELYQTATNLISNEAPDDMPEHRRDYLHSQAAQLLETGDGRLPDVDEMAEYTLEQRAMQLTEDDADEHYDGETEDLRLALEERGLA